MTYKLLRTILIFVFLITPLAPVFAVDVPVEEIVAEEPVLDIPVENTEVVADVLPDNVLPETEKETTPESQPSSMSETSVTQNPSQSFSKNQIVPEPDPTTGALVYDYSIIVPPGRQGMQPDLKLQYNSQGITQDSIVGFGWNINIPKIERINKHGVNKLYDYKDFRSSLSGELVYISGDDYEAKVENDSFLKYKLVAGVWIVTDKQGTIYKFGNYNDSKIYNLSDTDKIYSWYLDEVEDTNGNSIKYFYVKNIANNFIYPDKIIYTGNGASEGIFSVEFKKESRQDFYTINSAGFTQKINERIKSIETYISGTLKRRYDLTYVIGDNGKRSMLEKITENGRDALGVTTTLPSFDLTYTKGDINLVNTPSINYPLVPDDSGTMPFSFSDNTVKIMDINGDGLKDIVKSRIDGTGKTTFWVLKNNGAGWEVDNSWSQPTYSYINGSGRNITEYFVFSYDIDVADWNGDGKDDLIKFWAENLGNGQNKQQVVVLLNTGTGWVQNTNIETDVPTYTNPNAGTQILYLYSGPYGPENHFIDLNGDGLLDYIHSSNYQINGIDHPSFAVLYNDGEDLKWDSTVSQPYVKPSPTSGNEVFTLSGGTKILDINGDGLLDFMYAWNYQINGIDNPLFWVLINNGHGWDQDFSFIQPQYTSLGVNDNLQTNYFTSTREWLVVDINSDNLPDFIKFGPIDSGGGTYKKRKTVLVGTGKEWIQNDSLINIEEYTYTSYNAGAQTGYPSSGDSSTMFLDISGDGIPDITHAAFSQQQGIYYSTNWSLISNGKIANTLAKITLPESGSYDFSYKMTTAYRGNLGNLMNNNLSSSYHMVEKIIQEDSNNNTSVTNYEYAIGNFFYENAFNRRFAGFNIITKTDSAGNITKTYYHTADISDSAKGEYNDEHWKIGKVYRAEATDSSDNIYSKTINKWDSYDLGNGSKFVKLAEAVNYIYDSDITHKDTAESYTYNNNNGNLTQKIQWGEVNGSDDGTFLDLGSDKFTTNYTYATEVSSFKFQISIQNTTDQNANKVKERKYYYDNLALGSLTNGNLTKQEDWKTGVAYISNQKNYNSYGLMTTSTDPRGKTTQYIYDSYNLYPATITNTLNHATQYVYDYSSGQVIQKIDPNTRVFQYTYDGLDRLIEEKQPDLITPSTLVAKATYIYTDTPNSVSVRKLNYLDNANSSESYVYFDGLGRKIQERAEAEGVNFSVKDYVYNSLGLLEKESLPYFSIGFIRTSPTSDSNLYTNYTYDTLGRVVSLANSVGITTNTYSDWKVTTTDANNKAKDLYKDAYGNLVQIDEHNAGQINSTFYNYNYLGNLTKITDASQNIRNFTYDGLGRKLSAEDLHFSSDITFGTWTYAYDDAGNLTQTINPKNQTVNYTYDDMNRQLTEDYIGQAGIEVTNTYDAGIDGIGRLTGFVSSSLRQNNTYNPLGLLKTESKIINSNTYLTAYDYDRQGNQILITNPDNSQIKNIYNSAGILNQTQRKEFTDLNFTSVVDNFDYSPTGQITTQNYANGAFTINNYDAQKLYRLSNKVTTIAGSVRGQDLAYTYDNIGNITQVIDNSDTDSKKISNYVYDDLYRLISATITNSATGQSNYNQTFSYDAIGNILNKTETIGTNPTLTYTYQYNGNTGSNYANPHAVTSISDGAINTIYTYDRNGNMTAEGAKLYAFNYNNRLVWSSIPGDLALTPSSTATLYSLAGDGSTYKTSNSWSTAIGAAIGTSAGYIITPFKAGTGKSSTNYKIDRAFVPFDTSSLPDNAIVIDAKLKVYIAHKINNDNDGDDFITLVQGSQASTASLTISDYNKAGAVYNSKEGINITERKDITQVATNQYLVFNLNDTGKSWISKTGATKLGLREGHDVINSAFVGNADQFNQIVIRSSGYADTLNDPILEITYVIPPPPTIINYTYDPSGQRIKVVNNNSNITTFYPTNFYNINNSPTPKVTKHLFAGSQDIATIEGSGVTAVIYYNSTDTINSSSIMTDSAGAIAETMDYFPFGKIRLDIKPTESTFNEQRKYIGQEFDQETGLNYLNARYYNATLARFISEDPMFWNFDQSWLVDPQNQNSYAYARNNPITLSDPSGEDVWINSKPVFDVRGNYIGIHTYLKAVPDHPNEINIQGLPQGAEGFTMGGYNSSNNGLTNKLIKNMGTTETSWDKETAFGDGVKINSMKINPPTGQNDTQFINNLGKIYNETDLSGMNYYFRGTVNLPGGSTLYNGNCNNFSYTLGVKAGVKDQMDAFNPNLNISPLVGAYGYKNELPTQTLSQQVQSRINSLKEKVNSYVSSLVNKGK